MISRASKVTPVTKTVVAQSASPDYTNVESGTGVGKKCAHKLKRNRRDGVATGYKKHSDFR
jgi:hypothetical protein